MNIPVVVGAAFAIFSAYLLKHAITSYRRGKASLTWPSVDGRMTAVRLWGLRRVDGKMRDVERLAVEYVYEVNGTRYTGASAAFYSLVYPETADFAERHPVESSVRVFHDPADPTLSVLTPGPRRDKPFSDFILAALGLLVGIGVAVLGWK